MKKAFTLVELIVVITILAVLATVAFISFQGYASSSRDSVRITDISLVDKSLWLLQTKWDTLPLPDSAINISYSGSLLWTQWFFGESAYKQTSMTSAPKDPVTHNYIVYRLNENNSAYQLWIWLENSTTAWVFLSTTTYANDLSDRSILLKWKWLWIFVKQDNSSYDLNLDLANYNGEEIKAIIDETKNGQITGTWSDFRMMSVWWELSRGLVGYWSFDNADINQVISDKTLTWSTVVDISTLTSINKEDGKKWKWIQFWWNNDELNIKTGFKNEDFSQGISISFWYKNNIWNNNSMWKGLIWFWNFWNHIYGWSNDTLYLRFIPYDLYVKNLISIYDDNMYSFLRKDISHPYIQEIYNDWEYHLHTVSYDNKWLKLTYYIDDIQIYNTNGNLNSFVQSFVFSDTWEVITDENILSQISKVYSSNITTMNYSWGIEWYKNWSFYNLDELRMWKNSYWILDELRIYNRKLTQDEIIQLYTN